mmetsp:Transcript_4211/g.7393  ORF Transcript_4211/g.7393 Transcript_4211/m.7393 type:complete len:197 (+) Transcript_4211:44-634(+)
MCDIGVITVSDRAFRGEYEDRGGPAVLSFLSEQLALFENGNSESIRFHSKIVSDDTNQLTEAIKSLSSDKNCCLIVTTGGTGISERDITPQTTEALCKDWILHGFGERMRTASWDAGVKTAPISRATAGVYDRKTLIVNVPGSPKAVDCCLSAVLVSITHGLVHIGAPKLKIIQAHPNPLCAPHDPNKHHHDHTHT